MKLGRSLAALGISTVALLSALAVPAAGQSGATVTGAVTYLQRIALPPDAVVKVQIQDVSRADAIATVIGEQVIPTEGKQVPFPYSASYDPASIVASNRYVVRATITQGDTLLFTTDTVIPVITNGSPTENVEIVVVPVQKAEPSAKAAVTGVVTYRVRSALPDDATVRVTLSDISRADAPAQLIGEQVIATEGRQVPIPYSVAYDPSVIDERSTYAVRATISQGEQLLFTSDTVVPVITRGNPTDNVEIVTVPVPSSAGQQPSTLPATGGAALALAAGLGGVLAGLGFLARCRG